MGKKFRAILHSWEQLKFQKPVLQSMRSQLIVAFKHGKLEAATSVGYKIQSTSRLRYMESKLILVKMVVFSQGKLSNR